MRSSTGFDRVALARTLFAETKDPRGTLVERYLASRRISLDADLVKVLRFHPAMPWQADDGSRITVPGMVCAMTDIRTNELRAVHRTSLNQDASKIDKRMLGEGRDASSSSTLTRPWQWASA